VTDLWQIMLEELERRNYASATIRCHIPTVEHFARHFHRSPDQLIPEHRRQYQAAMFREWKFAPNTVTPATGGVTVFCVQVLKPGGSVAETPYPKKVLHLPEILSQEEVARLIDAAEFPFHRILLMTLYATGARQAARCATRLLARAQAQANELAVSRQPMGRSRGGSAA
jgi:integrase/recombinase XerD